MEIREIAPHFRQQPVTHVIRVLVDLYPTIFDATDDTVNSYEIPKGSVLAVCLVEPENGSYIVLLNSQDEVVLTEGAGFEILYELPKPGVFYLPAQYGNYEEEQ